LGGDRVAGQDQLIARGGDDIGPALKLFRRAQAGCGPEQVLFFKAKAMRRTLAYPVGLGVVEGVVVRAYSIAAWFPTGTTFSSRSYSGAGTDRWKFVGQRLDKHPLPGRLLVDDNGQPIAEIQKGYSCLPRA